MLAITGELIQMMLYHTVGEVRLPSPPLPPRLSEILLKIYQRTTKTRFTGGVFGHNLLRLAHGQITARDSIASGMHAVGWGGGWGLKCLPCTTADPYLLQSERPARRDI